MVGDDPCGHICVTMLVECSYELYVLPVMSGLVIRRGRIPHGEATHAVAVPSVSTNSPVLSRNELNHPSDALIPDVLAISLTY